MTNIAERGTNQPREQGRIDKVLHSPMSRRTFIKRAGVVLLSAEIAAACGVPAGATATAHPTTTGAESSPVTSFVPESIKPVDIPTLSSDTFNKVFGYYTDTTEVNIGGNQETVQSLASEASNIWNDGNLTSITVGRNSVEGLMFALSASELAGNTGTVDFSKIFKGLNIELPRFSISTLTNGKDTEEASNVSPESLTLRKGMDMTVVGIDDTKGNAMVAFSDTLRKPNNSPTMYFASIPVEASSSQLSFTELLARNGATYDSKTHEILYTNGKTLPIYKLDPTLSQSLEQETGSYFLDIDPLRTKAQGKTVYETSPVIPTLPSEFSKDKILQLSDGRIGVEDSTGKLVARARYSFSQSSWEWATDKESLADYTIREYADAEGVTVSVLSDKSYFGTPIYDSTLEAIANQIQLGGELDPNRVFKDFTVADWNKILSQWSNISASLDKGLVPEEFNYNWAEADTVVAYTKLHHMTIQSPHLFWSGQESTFPPSLFEGNFSNAQLTNLLEFMVKTRVLEYKGLINDWEGAAESAAYLTYAKPSFLVSRLGMGIIDKVFEWAHEANPDAKLRYTEDHVLETDDPSLLEGFWSLLQHFQQAKVPVNEIDAENNMWIFVPPNEQNMVNVLNRIKGMGFDIATPETTVVTSDQFPIWPTRTKTVTSIPDKLQAQAKIYSDIAKAYFQVGAKVFGFGGFTNADEWYTALASYNANAMIFDNNYQPEPAYYALVDVFKSYI